MKAFIAITTLAILAGCNQQTHDYVSDYDFSSALLEELPWEMGATLAGTRVWFHYDDYVREHHSGWSYIEHALGQGLFIDLSYVIDKQTGKPPTTSVCEICNDEGFCTNRVYWVDDPASIVPQYTSIDQNACRLNDGMLWCELQCSDGVVGVTGDKGYAPQLVVTRLESRDFNQDGYMDVLVQRELPGSSTPKEELVLSRKKPDGQFYVIEVLENSVRM